ncbi:MAG: LysR family transcriptional regulator [Nitrospirae bacterium]|nr:LysR family transcriptional regulator [Nitrospirota bacterium]
MCYNGYMQIRSKIWLEVDGETVFGSGKRALLEGIIKYGSINKAAKEINISYRKALSYIQLMEQRLGIKLVERKAGGKNGGGAALTKNAEEFLVKYKELEEGVTEIIDSKFSGIFGATRSLKRSTGKKIR